MASDTPIPFRTETPDGVLEFHITTVDEAKLAIKELKLKKKEMSLAKKEIKERQRQIRAQYTDAIRRQGSKFRGGGWIGGFIRGFQTAKRDDQRAGLAQSLAPLENLAQRMDACIVEIDALILKIELHMIQGRKDK